MRKKTFIIIFNKLNNFEASNKKPIEIIVSKQLYHISKL